MKSLANSVLNIAVGLLKDARLAYPRLGESLSLDESRLSLYNEKRLRSLDP